MRNECDDLFPLASVPAVLLYKGDQKSVDIIAETCIIFENAG